MADDNDRAGPSRLPDAGAPAMSSATPAGPATAATSGLPTDNLDESAAAGASSYRALRQFSFPWAAQPEIVRAYQKDAYYRDLFVLQLKDVVRTTLGVRALHNHADLVAAFGGIAYFALCALGGAQTLGEEYVNAMMVDGKTGRVERGKVGLDREGRPCIDSGRTDARAQSHSDERRSSWCTPSSPSSSRSSTPRSAGGSSARRKRGSRRTSARACAPWPCSRPRCGAPDPRQSPRTRCRSRSAPTSSSRRSPPGCRAWRASRRATRGSPTLARRTSRSSISLGDTTVWHSGSQTLDT